MLWAGCQFCSSLIRQLWLARTERLQVACVGSYSGSQYPTRAHPGSPWGCPLLLHTEQDSTIVFYSAFWTWTMSPNAQKIFTRQMEKILSCDRTRAWSECTDLIFLSFHILPFPWKTNQSFPQATCGTPSLKVVQVTLRCKKFAQCKSPQHFLVPATLKKSAYNGFMPHIRQVSYLLFELCPKLPGKQSSRCKPDYFGDGTRM